MPVSALVLTALLAATPAGASESPAPMPMPMPTPAVQRSLSFGLGATSLSAFSPPGTRAGVALDLRHMTPIAPRLRFGLTLTTGLTTFRNTVAVAQWSMDHAVWTTEAFGAVHEWSSRPAPTSVEGFKVLGSIFAYFGLALSYAVVPVALVISPFASVGHLSLAPTVSLHTSDGPANGYLEAGVGGLLYGHPGGSGPQAGLGPVVGVGGQVGRTTVGLRVLLSPPGFNDGAGDTVVETALVLGL